MTKSEHKMRNCELFTNSLNIFGQSIFLICNGLSKKDNLLSDNESGDDKHLEQEICVLG